MVGAGAAGLYTALVAAEQRRARRARVALAAGPVGELLGAGRARGRARARRQRRAAPRRHARRRPRRDRRERAAEILCDEAPERVRELEQRGIAFDRSPDGRAAAVARGRPHAPPRRARRRQRDRPPRDGAAVASWSTAARRHRGARAQLRAGACGSTTAAASASSPTRRRSRPRATVLATGGAAALWQRTTNPRGAIGAGLLLAHEAGAALADLEFMQFHPTALRSPRRARRLPRHRGRARRRRAAGRRATASGSWTSWRRATRSRARSHERHARRRRRAFLDMRDGRPAARSRTSSSACAGAGSTRARDLVPVAPAAHYMIGGVVTDEHGPLDAARPLRGRRMRMHRGARRQPAGLELALGVLRVRPPRRARRDRGAGAARRAARRRPPPAPDPPDEETRAALWQRRRAAARRRRARAPEPIRIRSPG